MNKQIYLLGLIVIISFMACDNAESEAEYVKSPITFVPFVKSNGTYSSTSFHSSAKIVYINRPEDGSIQSFIDYMKVTIENEQASVESIYEKFEFVDDNSGDDIITLDVYAGINTALISTDAYVIYEDCPKQNQIIEASTSYELEYNTDNTIDGLTYGQYELDGTNTEQSNVVAKLREADPYAPYMCELTFEHDIDTPTVVNAEMRTDYGRVIATFTPDEELRSLNATVKVDMLLFADQKNSVVYDQIKTDNNSHSISKGSWLYWSNYEAFNNREFVFLFTITYENGETETIQSQKTYYLEAGKDTWIHFDILPSDLSEVSSSTWTFITPWEEANDIGTGNWN